ncbi:MAG: porin family protein [Pseudomonadota bacterium]|nr:porin family protein [Pseudomonadota bacterium]
MFNKFAVAATLAFACASSVAAEPASFYIGADIGSTRFDPVSGNQIGAGGFVGYAFNSYVALEANYRSLGQYDGIYINGVKTDLSLNHAAVSVIGTLPLAGGFNVFGRYGRTKLESTVSAGNVKPYGSGNGAEFGVGVGYAFTPNVALRLEYLSPAKELRNISAGVSYKF